MNKDSLIQNTVSTLYSTLFIAFLCLLGCASLGGRVPAENRIALSETKQVDDTFKAEGLTVKYSYLLRENSMSITCNATLRFRVKSYDVRILFLDAQGTILQQKIVYSSGQRTVKTFLDVPPGAVSISFKYSSQPYRGRA